jgi:hypothetical protein
MEVIKRIIDLPTDLCVNLLCDWTDAPCLARFDSAMCSKQFRNLFLFDLFARQTFVIEGCDHAVKYGGLETSNMKFDSWVNLRMIKVRKVFLINSEEMHHCFEKSKDLSKINCLELFSFDCGRDVDTCVKLINSCRGLKRLLSYYLVQTSTIFGRLHQSILRNLKELYVADGPHRPLTVQFAECIATSCSSLTYLNMGDVSHGSWSKDVVNQFELILKNNPRLMYINLENTEIGDSLLSTVALHCPCVKHVWIVGGKDLTIGAVTALQFVRTSTLVDLHVKMPGKRTFSSTEKIPRIRFHVVSPDNERVVRLTDFSYLSTDILSGIFQQQRHPTTRLLLNSINLTSAMLLMIANCNPQLRLFAVDSCGELFSKDAVKCLVSVCDTLTHLHLGNCVHLTPADHVEIFALVGERLQVASITTHQGVTAHHISKIISSCVVLKQMVVYHCDPAYYWREYKYSCCENPQSCVCARRSVIPEMQFKYDNTLLDRIDDSAAFVQNGTML